MTLQYPSPKVPQDQRFDMSGTQSLQSFSNPAFAEVEHREQKWVDRTWLHPSISVTIYFSKSTVGIQKVFDQAVLETLEGGLFGQMLIDK